VFLGVDGGVWDLLVDRHVTWTFSRPIWPVRKGQNTETPTPQNIEQVRVVVCYFMRRRWRMLELGCGSDAWSLL
jgi:hypothetical protein